MTSNSGVRAIFAKLVAVIVGYAAAVVAAVLTVTLIASIDAGSVSDIGGFLMAGLTLTSIYGAPGFLAVMLIAYSVRVFHPAFMVACGALNAPLAFAILEGGDLEPAFMSEGWLFWLGGAVGGLAFWRTARSLGGFELRPRSTSGATEV